MTMRAIGTRMSKQQLVHALCRALPSYDRATAQTPPRSLWHRVVARVRHELLTRNPGLTVVTRLSGREIELPYGHSLLNLLVARPLYESEFNRLLQSSRDRQQPLHIIDIGANIGDTVIRVSHELAAEWLCIEAHPEFFALLEKNCRSMAGVTCVLSVVSDTDAVESVAFTERLGTASIVNGAAAAGLSADRVQVRMESMSRILDRYPVFLEAAIFKCDTDGFEPAVFRGALPFLSRVKPRLYFELSPRHWRAYSQATPEAGIDLLRGVGYADFLYYDEEGYLFGVDNADALSTLKALQTYAVGRKYGYWNVIAFHADEAAAAKIFIAAELDFFELL